MASTSAAAQQGSPRRLVELLEEKQDPFVLDIYLLERGCRRKRLEFSGRIGCFFSDNGSKNHSGKQLKKVLSDHGRNRSNKKSSAQFSNIARTLFNKFDTVNQILRVKNSSSGDKKRSEKANEAVAGVVDAERLSSSSNSTVCNTCSGSESEGESFVSPARNSVPEVAPDSRTMSQWRFSEDNKQCSPVSVLEEIDFLHSIPVYSARQQETPSASRVRSRKDISEDSILSASLWELLVDSRKGKPNQASADSLPQYANSKKALQQTRQLLFDCVRDAVEEKNSWLRTISGKEKGLMCPEEIGKIVCKNMKAWGKISVDERNIKYQLKADLLSSTEERSGLEVCKKQISAEIADGIFLEIIDETVRNMID